MAQTVKGYMPAKPCRHGHMALRRYCDHACTECRRLRRKPYKEQEGRREYMRAYMQARRAEGVP